MQERLQPRSLPPSRRHSPCHRGRDVLRGGRPVQHAVATEVAPAGPAADRRRRSAFTAPCCEGNRRPNSRHAALPSSASRASSCTGIIPTHMTDIRQLAIQCRDAAQALAVLPTAAKDAMLRAMADALEADVAGILQANAQDLTAAAEKGVGTAMLDRLRLDHARVGAIAAALREVADLPDPVGQVTRHEVRPNGISVERVRMPLGVVAMIYEARPNVTADAAALCLKAGNGVILRGGSEAIASNTAIAASLHRALGAAGIPAAALTLVEDLRRETMLALLQLSDIVDLAIPRGGEGLIRFVTEHARVPVIKHYKGVCHLYVDADADQDLALRLLVDGKV